MRILRLDREELLNLRAPFVQFASAIKAEKEELDEESATISASLSRLMRTYNIECKWRINRGDVRQQLRGHIQ